MRFPQTIADFPYIVLELRCSLCPWRRGRYRLARLAERFGADANLDMVRRELAKPCPRLAHRGSGMLPGCRVELWDFNRHPYRPADAPTDADP